MVRLGVVEVGEVGELGGDLAVAGVGERPAIAARLASACSRWPGSVKNTALRYCVPTSLPWRMPWVGSWSSQNSLSNWS